MKRTIVLLLIAVLGVTSLSFGEEPFRKSYEKLENGDSIKINLRKLYDFSKIAMKRENDTLFEAMMNINPLQESCAFYTCFEDFKRWIDRRYNPETPNENEWWEKVWGEWATYCDEHYAVNGLLGKTWDIRADDVLVNGPPDNWSYESDLECERTLISAQGGSGRSEKCNVWRYFWIGPNGTFSISYEGDWDEGRPSRIRNSDTGESDDVFRGKKEIDRLAGADIAFQNLEGKKLKFDFCVDVFPNKDGLYTSWMSSAFPLSQFSSDSLGNSHFRVEIFYYDQYGHLVRSDSSQVVTFKKSEIPDINKRAYPLYLSSLLPEGKYRATANLEEPGTKNRSTRDLDIQVPSKRASTEMSDILLFDRRDFTRPYWIKRGDRFFQGTPKRKFSDDDTISFYVETILPTTSFLFSVGAYLICESSGIEIPLARDNIRNPMSTIQIDFSFSISKLKNTKKLKDGKYFLAVSFSERHDLDKDWRGENRESFTQAYKEIEID